jgi:hypothetical protein
MSNTGQLRLENTEKGVFTGTCTCDCGGGGGSGSCPHPSFAYSGVATADFAKTERCMAVGEGIMGNLTFSKMPGPDVPSLLNPDAIVISDDGNTVCVAGRVPPYFVAYKWNGTTYAKLPDPIGVGSDIYMSFVMTGDGSRIIGSNGYVPKVFSWNGSTYEKTAELDISPITSMQNGGLALSQDGNRLFVTGNANGTKSLIFDWDESLSLYINRNQLSSPIVGFPYTTTSDDGNIFALRGDSTELIRVYAFNGVAFEARQIDEQPTTSCKGLYLSGDGRRIFYAQSDGGYTGGTAYEWDGEMYRKITVAPPRIDVNNQSRSMSADGSLLVGQKGIMSWSASGTLTAHYNIFGTQFNHQTISRNGNVVAGVFGKASPYIEFYRRDPATLGEIRPFVSIADAAATEGLVGVGFTRNAISQGNIGTADIMFE